ncbi:MAG: 4Fe-4S binding protein [Spirochaetales bacterium]|nr:4Fe-4S binding protein [Spirochaetales bacterium]
MPGRGIAPWPPSRSPARGPSASPGDTAGTSKAESSSDRSHPKTRLRVDTPRCRGCGICVTVCPVKAITMRGAIPVIDNARCTDCGRCIEACHFGAILREADPAAAS